MTVRSFDIHVFTDRTGRVCASVTESNGRRTRPIFLPLGARLALEHILHKVKVAHAETETKQ